MSERSTNHPDLEWDSTDQGQAVYGSAILTTGTPCCLSPEKKNISKPFSNVTIVSNPL